MHYGWSTLRKLTYDDHHDQCNQADTESHANMLNRQLVLENLYFFFQNVLRNISWHSSHSHCHLLFSFLCFNQEDNQRFT
jgi:hypothetical protein